jgi:putative oxidoreductase
MNNETSRVDTALLALRIIIGIIFVMHGGQKLFVYGLGGVTKGFQGMNIPAATISAPLVAIVEFLGGLGLIFGLLTRLAGLGLAIDMLGAMALVHFKNGFFINPPAIGYEYTLALFAAALTLAIGGAGAYSIDAMISRRRAAV